MSFEKMERDDLYRLATENFGVEVSETADEQAIIVALNDNGVTWEMAKTYDASAAAIAEKEEESKGNVVTSAAAQVKDVPEPKKAGRPRKAVVEILEPEVPAEDVILIKMDRENPRYDIRGYKFTREAPFALVKESDADFILTHEEGFKQATPKEAKEFYG